MSLLQSLFIAVALSACVWQTSASTSVSPGSGFQYSRQADIQPAQTSFRYPRRGKRAPNAEQQKHADTPRKYEQDNRMTESVSQDSSSSSNEARHSTSFVAECEMPTAHGDFKMRSYRHESSSQKLEPVVIVSGDVNGAENVIVRVHDQCFTSEVFGSLRCDCREQLQESLKLIREKNGLVIYLQQEGRGIGISNKIAAYSLQDDGIDTVDANIRLGFKDELREYNAVPDILRDMGIKSIKLITNNPFKIDELRKLGVQITERIPMQIPSNKHNSRYLKSKRDRMNHIFMDMDDDGTADININADHSINFSSPSDSAEQDHQREMGFTPNNQASYTPTAASVSESMFESNEYAQPGMNAQYGYSQPTPVPTAVPSMQPTSQPTATPSAAPSTHGSKEECDPRTKGYAFGKHTVEAAIQAIKEGKIVVVTDDEDRENEGDLIMAAEKATPETVGFIVRYTSGVICISMESERLEALKLPPMVINNEDPKQTAYTVSVDYKHGTTTGISAADRAAAFRALADPKSTPDDFQRPGHVFPLRYRAGGVIVRGGHTEASLDLTRLAGLQPAGVLAEVVNDDGSIMRLPGLKKMAKEFGLVLTSVQDILAYRLETEQGVQFSSSKDQ